MSIAKQILAAVPVMLIVVTTASSLQAQTPVFRYRQGGAWGNVSDGMTPGWGVNPASPGLRVPIAGDEARVNWGGSTVTLDYAAPSFLRLLIGVDEPGTVQVDAGGVLATSEDIRVGNNGAIEGYLDVNDGGVVNVGRILWVARASSALPSTFGQLNINAGGTVNVASHLWWGVFGTAEINISGTLNQTNGILGLGTDNAVDARGGTAIVNVLDGGNFKLNNISSGATLPSIQAGSFINIQGTGRMTLPGDFIETLGRYRDAGVLLGDGVVGAVTIQTESGGQPAGDYNADGVVDAADYTTWRDSVGLAALPNSAGLGVVGSQHYDLWVANYGSISSLITVVTAGLPSLAVSVPEPGAIATVGVVSIMLAGASRRKQRV